MGKTLPLYKRTHFRHLRDLFSQLCEHENVNSEAYDFYNIKCYETHGQNMNGVNVKHTRSKSFSFFVDEDSYDVYEVPAVQNRQNQIYGNYLFLVKNHSTGKYYFGDMRVFENRNRSGRFNEFARFTAYGEYNISQFYGRPDVYKTKLGYDVYTVNGSKKNGTTFDSNDDRKRAYKTTYTDVVQKHKLSKTNNEAFSNKDSSVKIYKRRTNNGTKPVSIGRKKKNNQ